MPPGLGDDVMERAEALLHEAEGHDARVLEQQGAYDAVHAELERWVILHHAGSEGYECVRACIPFEYAEGAQELV